MKVELPGIGIVEFPDGTSEETIARAYREFLNAKEPGPTNTNPGVSSDAPPGMFYNPNTGQYTSRELLANRDVGGLEAFSYGGAQGATFGGMDELAGAVNAAVPGRGTAAERYVFGRELSRALEDAAYSQRPFTTGAGEAAGAVSTALAYGLPAIAERGLLGAVAGNAAVGGAEGAGYGLLSGEGGLPARVMNAVRYGTLGTAAGAAAPLVVSAVRGGARAVGDLIGGGVDAALGRGSQTRANRAISKTVERSGRSVGDIDAALAAAAREGQPDYRVMDALGVPGMRRVRGITVGGDEGSQELVDFLNKRQLGQPERVSSFLNEGFNTTGDSAAARSTRFIQDRAERARKEYEAAAAVSGPVNLNSAIDTIDELLGRDPIINETALRETAIGRRLVELRDQMQKGGEQLIDFSRVLDIKKELGDAMAGFGRRGEAVPAPLARVYGALDDALESSSDLYRAANDNYREASLVIDAIERGRAMARPGERAVDTTAAFGAMTPDQQAAARIGYGDELLRRVEVGRSGANRADPLMTPKITEEIGAMATDPGLLSRRIGRENEMFRLRNAALGGSPTAEKLIDTSEMQDFSLGLLGSLATGNFGSAARRVAAELGNLTKGMSAGTREIVARAMMARDTDALQAALAQASSEAERKLIADIVLRAWAVREAPEAPGAKGLLQ